ncbi:hypothetical protein M3J09_006705 [Ascochyta lentis]
MEDVRVTGPAGTITAPRTTFGSRACLAASHSGRSSLPNQALDTRTSHSFASIVSPDNLCKLATTLGATETSKPGSRAASSLFLASISQPLRLTPSSGEPQFEPQKSDQGSRDSSEKLQPVIIEELPNRNRDG